MRGGRHRDSATFRLALAADYPLGRPVALSVKTSFAGTLSPTYTTARIPTGQPATAPTTFTYAGPPVAIPDDSTIGASVTIPVEGVGYGSRVTFSIDGALCTTNPGATTVGLDHTFVGDLVGTLIAPDDSEVTLFARDGGPGNNICQAVFDDSSADAVRPGSVGPRALHRQLASGGPAGLAAVGAGGW